MASLFSIFQGTTDRFLRFTFSLYFCAYKINYDVSLIIDAARLTLLDPCPSEEAMVG